MRNVESLRLNFNTTSRTRFSTYLRPLLDSPRRVVSPTTSARSTARRSLRSRTPQKSYTKIDNDTTELDLILTHMHNSTTELMRQRLTKLDCRPNQLLACRPSRPAAWLVDARSVASPSVGSVSPPLAANRFARSQVAFKAVS